jgi:hypothetical protein
MAVMKVSLVVDKMAVLMGEMMAEMMAYPMVALKVV